MTLRRLNRESDRSGNPVAYINNSYENRVLYWLSNLDRHFAVQGISYALFGGAAVAAYVGHLPRKLHDLDILLFPADVEQLVVFLKENGFDHQKQAKSVRAGFAKLILKNHVYEMIISAFPARFILLDIDKEDMPVLATYDFAEALSRTVRREIRNLANEERVTVSAVPLEDLIISKLWPTFEPNTVHDLLLLLSCGEASQLDFAYLKHRLGASPPLCKLCVETLEKFQKAFPWTAWYQLASENRALSNSLSLLTETFAELGHTSLRPLSNSVGNLRKRVHLD
jgi:hypothetical protein